MIRSVIPSDLPAILALLDRAFAPSTYESRLVSRIPPGEPGCLGWVHERAGEPLGYVLYTPALRGTEVIGYHLAPVAVCPAHHRTGIGSELIRTTLASAALAEAPVFVLGDPAYYERFGFGKVVNPTCPYDESNAYFRALRWQEPAEPFSVGYHPAFKEAGEPEA